MAWIRRRLSIRDKARGPKQQVRAKSAHPPTPTVPHTYMTGVGFSSFFSTPVSRLRRSCLRLNSWSHAWHDSDGGIAVYLFLSNCLSSELREGFCQYSRAFFALGAIYLGIFARRALVRSRTPMILCLSNARSGDLHFGTSFVALRALVREIIPNTIHTYIHTYMT